MDDLIDKVVELENGDSYIVVNQTMYQNIEYILVAKLSEDEEEILDDFVICEKINNGDLFNLLPVEDHELLDKLVYELIDKEM